MNNKYNQENTFSFLEPNGHLTAHSKIERCWERFDGPFSLNRKRTVNFSVYEGMSHSPLRYYLNQFELSAELPSTEFISEHLNNLIKVEFSNNPSAQNYNFNKHPQVKKTTSLSEEEFLDFIKKSEWPQRISLPIIDENSPEQIAGAIFDILCNSKIGNYKNKINNSKEEFIQQLIPKILDKERIMFVLLGFPFKDQNRFRVPYDADNIDFSEISLMLRLFSLTQTIYQVHPYGVDIVVLTDGGLYKDIFEIENSLVDSYFQKLKHYRNKLNLQGAISFIPLNSLIDRASNSINLNQQIKHIENTIVELLELNKNGISEQFEILLQGIKWNMNNSISIFDNLTETEVLSIIKSQRNEVESNLYKIWDEYNDLAKNASIRYAAINIIMKYHDLINNFFPESIRSTVHPKKGQFGLTSSQNSFPWNGVAYSKDWPNNTDDIRCVPYYSLCDENHLMQITFPNSSDTCFFTSSEKNINIKTAIKVLNPQKWEFDIFNGREFVLSDLSDFTIAGKKDELYTWERTEQGEAYFSGLLQFRLSHYKKHGFGVHGLWHNDKLIGQFGLQVLNEEEDKVEIVLFLIKEYRKKGYGFNLFNFLISECKKNGIKDLYGVIKSENKEASSLLNKFNSIRIGTIKHFREQGVLYKLKI